MTSSPTIKPFEILREVVTDWTRDERDWLVTPRDAEDALRHLEEQLETLRGPLEQIAGLHPSDADQAPHIARRTLERAGFNPANSPRTIIGWNCRHADCAGTPIYSDEDPASSPNVTNLPVCPECTAGRHIYCLDDGSSTWTGKCRCTCGDESRPAREPHA